MNKEDLQPYIRAWLDLRAKKTDSTDNIVFATRVDKDQVEHALWTMLHDGQVSRQVYEVPCTYPQKEHVFWTLTPEVNAVQTATDKFLGNVLANIKKSAELSVEAKKQARHEAFQSRLAAQRARKEAAQESKQSGGAAHAPKRPGI